MLGMNDDAAPDMIASDMIKDGSDAAFMADVIEASQTTPVIVDFWAPWCGPCRQLTPAIEQAVTAAGGKVKLVKINIDEHPGVAGQLGVQSLPTVYAFAGGRPVDAFMGAQPPSELKKFIEKLLAASGDPEAEQINAALDAADAALEEGAAPDAAQIYAQVLAADSANPRALGGLIRSYAALQDAERAREILNSLTDELRADPEIKAAEAVVALAETTAGVNGETAALAAAVDADPNNLQTRYDYALALLADGDQAESIDQLLELFRCDRDWNDGAAQEQLLKIFDGLGPKDLLAQSGRRRLSSLIFA